MSGRVARASVSSMSSMDIVRYVVLGCLFTATVCLQVGSIEAYLHQVPVNIPGFLPGFARFTLEYVDHKAAAAGLNRGDILIAINGRPYTGRAVFLEELQRATPGSTLAVTVRSPGANSQERTIRISVARGNGWKSSKPFVIAAAVVMPVLCIGLGFWVVLVRPHDPLAWLLLGVLFSFAQILSGTPPVGNLGPAVYRLEYGYSIALGAAWPLFMFLFGFYFPEPLPFFARAGTWRKWVPLIMITPFAIYELAFVAVAVGDLSSYSSVERIYRVLHPIRGAVRLYYFCLVGAFFGLIFAKSAIALSPDAKRRLRLLYWGATVALSPLLLLAVR
jgi:phosphoserine phosphatase RsbU/P